MRGQSLLLHAARGPAIRSSATQTTYRQCRAIQISASPSTESPGPDAFGAPPSRDLADARFEVLGSPYSLLSVTLSASQKLYTRRGTLVAVAGNAENAQSTLSILAPLRRLLGGIPFLYQRITSTSPITALVATRSPTTTFSVLHLDGTTDWVVSQRNALLAWTGHTLRASPRLNLSMSLAYLGSTHLTGRGLAALSSPGQAYRLELADGESLVAHPSHVVAYSVGRAPAPAPFRLRSGGGGIRFQVPSVGWLPEVRAWQELKMTKSWKRLARVMFAVRTALRRSVWGDRLFLRFEGPGTLLLSSRGVRMADALTNADVNEIADAEAGVVGKAVKDATAPKEVIQKVPLREAPTVVRTVEVRDGKVTFEDGKELKDKLQ